MTEGQSEAYKFVKNLYDNHVIRVESDGTKEKVMSFFESYEEEVVFDQAQQIEDKLFDTGEKKSIVRRVYSISIEALQNMKLHGSSDEYGLNLAGYMLFKSDTIYYIDFVNLCDKEQGELVKSRVTKLNEMEPADLKQHYLTVMQNGERSTKGGAGLGLITMVMKSKNPVKCHVVCEGEDCALITRVKINRK